MTRRFNRLIAFIALSSLGASQISAYSVLSHEALVDALWDVSLVPALKARFPAVTADELKKAHAYAYGGAIIQDLGYYPNGNKMFSDLTHYVRSGDFVMALMKDSETPEDYAFALGALSHYVSDNDGHRLATNRAVPKLYPKLREKYGDVVTYEDNPAAHLKTEFGFDVLEVAKANFAPEAYHDFIGFSVPKPLLERAFQETYGLALSDLFHDEDRTISSFRHVVSKTIPEATRIAWAQRQEQIERSQPGITRKKFEYNISRSSYEKEWGKQYDRPSAKDRFLSFLLRLVPKIGPLKALNFRMPTPEVEEEFMKSFNQCVTTYKQTITRETNRDLHLVNGNFDVGVVTSMGQYHLADETYAKLLHDLAKKQFKDTPKALADNILSYYREPSHPVKPAKGEVSTAELESDLQQLKEYEAVRGSS